MHTAFVIDDDPFSLFLAQQLLKLSNGFKNIVVFTNPNEALETLKKQSYNNPPDIILLDINMPIMSGWEFLDALNIDSLEHLRDCKIYLITSSFDGAETIKLETYTFIKDIIYKPVTLEDIQIIINELVSV